MSETVEPRTEDIEELNAALRELEEANARRDALEFEKQKLLEGVPAHNAEKERGLREDLSAIARDVNDAANANMAKEIEAMDKFSENVKAFNDLATDYLIEMKLLKKTAGEE